MTKFQMPFFFMLMASLACGCVPGLVWGVENDGPLSPESIVASLQTNTLYIAEKTACQIAVFDAESCTVRSTISLPAEPMGLALSHDSQRLYVTCSGAEGVLCIIDVETEKIVGSVKVGLGACSPVVRNDDQRIYVCNRFENSVSVVDPQKQQEIARCATDREPQVAVLSDDGKFLFVAHHLPAGRADQATVSSTVQIIQTQGLQTIEKIILPSGSTCLKGICITPDGRYVFVTHILAHFQLPATQLERGWINTNALSIIDAKNRSYVNTVLLDDVDRGAANPWGVMCSPDGKYLGVVHSGMHELSLIDLPAFTKKFESLPEEAQTSGYGYSGGESGYSTSIADALTDLTFMVKIRKRVKLEGKGPRGLAFLGSLVYVPCYFSDNLNIIDLKSRRIKVSQSIALGKEYERSTERWGEELFFDATLCFQGWQSCGSCHPDARVDGLNWDLLNDGIGNPKNSKSLLLSHRTPPAMSLGVRADAEYAVRSGLRHILFVERPEEEAKAMDEYLKSMKPMDSPIKNDASFAQKIENGKRIFFSRETHCASCHSGPLFTDMKLYDVGLQGPYDRHSTFDNPSLIELWRTGPYLHDGRAASLRDVISTWNAEDRHGRTSHLSEEQMADLEAFLLSL